MICNTTRNVAGRYQDARILQQRLRYQELTEVSTGDLHISETSVASSFGCDEKEMVHELFVHSLQVGKDRSKSFHISGGHLTEELANLCRILVEIVRILIRSTRRWGVPFAIFLQRNFGNVFGDVQGSISSNMASVVGRKSERNVHTQL